jgi:hypothetical protein
MARHTRTTVALVAVAAVGFPGCGVGETDPEPVTRPPERGASVILTETGGPTDVRQGVPVGWAHDADGARAAAVSAVSLTGEIAHAGFITRGDMIDVLATNRFAPDLAVTTERQLGDLAEALGAVELLPPEVTWTEVPLTARVGRVNETAARVQVWSVVVVARPDAGVPRQAWRTVSIDLAWESADWKVDGWSATPGPTPALAAAAAISTADEVNDVAQWPPAAGTESPPGDGGDGGGG